LGSVARWAVAAAMPSVGGGFPSATFVVNVTGCALIGALMHAEETLWPPARYRRPFLRTGLLGGFTTFSAYGLDTHSLLLAGATVVAVVYVLTSVVGGLLAVRLGAAGAAALAIPVGRLRRPGGTPAAGGEGG
jgi:CrcB protein